MNVKLSSRITKSHWDNGQPSIDVNPYDFSEPGFNALLVEVSQILGVETPDYVMSLDTYVAEIDYKDTTITVHMDNYTCSISLTTVDMREQLFQKIKSGN
ncbi:MAG: hypothetical protein IT287_09380 [Bdellovibrionaceae bacterium]|nr:hypothetical protein [Pseudobdellovibrionaceae bacterium]